MNLYFRFSDALNFFLRPSRRQTRFAWPMDRRAAVKDIIESLGVPHTEIGSIRYNGSETDFSFVPTSGGRVDVAGISPPFEVRQASFLRPRPLETIRFVADVNVMKLGRLLLLLGFDVACSDSFSDGQIADLAQDEGRVVLTRDTVLLNRKKIVFARRIRCDRPYDQLGEVVSFFGLKDQIRFLSRCSRCNLPLASVDKSDVMPLLEPKTKLYYHRFFQCPACQKVFWNGSHCEGISRRFREMGLLPDG